MAVDLDEAILNDIERVLLILHHPERHHRISAAVMSVEEHSKRPFLPRPDPLDELAVPYRRRTRPEWSRAWTTRRPVHSHGAFKEGSPGLAPSAEAGFMAGFVARAVYHSLPQGDDRALRWAPARWVNDMV